MRELNANVKWLGEYVDQHDIGDYSFIEITPRGGGDNKFLIFIDGKDVNVLTESLDEGLLVAIAIKYDGRNTQAHHYFARMIGMVKE